jgi:hypothetical protein
MSGAETTRAYTDVQQPRADCQHRVKIEEQHRLLKCFHDLSDFCSRDFNVITAQVVFILLSYTLRQWQLWKLHQEELAGGTPGLMRRRLNLRKQYVVIYLAHAYAQMPLIRFTREVLELEPQARAVLRASAARLWPKFENWSRACLTPLMTRPENEQHKTPSSIQQSRGTAAFKPAELPQKSVPLPIPTH